MPYKRSCTGDNSTFQHMGDWVIGALVNVVGSVTINLGTNLLELGHGQRKKLSEINGDQGNVKFTPKSILHFQTWRIGILLFAVGNCLSFMSFAYAAQSLLAALDSIQRGEYMLSKSGKESGTHWRILLPFSYAVVSGAVGSCSVLFAKSLSNMLRLTAGSRYHLHSWFTYSVLLLFLGTAGFWMTRLNEGLSLFDAILIVPMFQIVWTFFSMCTGFVYFQEYQVFDTLRLTMFLLGIAFVFVGISVLAPDNSEVTDAKDSSRTRQGLPTMNRHGKMQAEGERSFVTSVKAKAKCMLPWAKAVCMSLSNGLAGSSSISDSSASAMPLFSEDNRF